jgi:hypothetical protein
VYDDALLDVVAVGERVAALGSDVKKGQRDAAKERSGPFQPERCWSSLRRTGRRAGACRRIDEGESDQSRSRAARSPLYFVRDRAFAGLGLAPDTGTTSITPR